MLFRLHNFEFSTGALGQIAYLGKLFVNMAFNTTLMPFITGKNKRDGTNRFYLVIKPANV